MKALVMCYDISVSPQNALDVPTENIMSAPCRGMGGSVPFSLCCPCSRAAADSHPLRVPGGCQWAKVAQGANAAAAIPQYQVPFTWTEEGWDAAFPVIEIQYAWEPFAVFSNLSEKASLQQLFCNPAKARNAFTEARAAQPCRHSSRQCEKQHKWWKVSKKLTLLWSPVIPSAALFKPCFS